MEMVEAMYNWRCSSVVERRSETGELSPGLHLRVTVGKPSAVGQLTRSTQPFVLSLSLSLWVDKCRL